MAIETKRCAGPCGRVLPADEENFQPFTSATAGRVLRRKCRRCWSEMLVAQRAAKRAAWEAQVRAAGVLECRGPCRAPKKVADFERGAAQRIHRWCRSCRNTRARVYKQTPQWRRWHTRARVKTREQSRRTKARCGRSGRAVTKVQSWINQNVQCGKVAKPDRCQRCPHSRAAGYRIAGHLPPGKTTLADVEWYCYPCLWLVKHPEAAAERREVARECAAVTRGAIGLEASPADLLARLTVDTREWRALHEAHAVALELEEGPVDDRREVARALWGSLFRDTVFSPGAEERLGRALA